MSIEVTVHNTGDDFKAYLLECLRGGVVKLVFHKSDGTLREMTATLNGDLIEQADATPRGNEDGTWPYSETSQPVLDTEKGEWRSFRWDRLVRVDVD